LFQPENCITTYEPHAYVVIYSVAEKETKLAAEETLQFLWKSASVGTKAVILVGNKTDLVRSRAVTTDGEFAYSLLFLSAGATTNILPFCAPF